MSCNKILHDTISVLRVQRALARTGSRELSLNIQLNSEKKGGSATLLSSYPAAHRYPTLKDVPGPRPSIPFIGTGWQYFPGGRYNLANLHEAAVDKFRRYGPIVKEEFQWRKPVVHLYSPEDFHTVFGSGCKYPTRPIIDFLVHYRLSNPDKYDTAGLANSVGTEWHRLRSTVGKVLTKAKTDFLVEDVDSICEDFVSLIRRNRNPETFAIENLQDMCYRLALEAVYLMSLDTRLGCLDSELRPGTPAFNMIFSVKLLFEAFQELYFGLPFWKLFQTPSYRKLDTAESIMYDATNKRIQEALETLRHKNEESGESSASQNSTKPRILQALLNCKDLTDKEIRVTVIDFISGGIFTVTNAFSFLIYHIASNPKVQEKLYAELREHIPDSVVTCQSLEKMPYLKSCVKESFRLTPTIPSVSRILTEDAVLSGYLIPAGTTLFCNFVVPCKEAKLFPEPEKFLPDRWNQRITGTDAYTLLPFGHGKRACIGRRFAEMEMYTALAKLVYNFKLESTGQELKCKQAFIVVPSHPLSITFKDR